MEKTVESLRKRLTELLRPPRVLLVEDSEVDAHLARSLLEQLGCGVTWERTAEEAQTQFGQEYDLMLVDLFLPGMDGVELMRRAREAAPHLPIAVVTALSEGEALVKAVEGVGAVTILKKPVSLESLRLLLNRRRGEGWAKEIEAQLVTLEERAHYLRLLVLIYGLIGGLMFLMTLFLLGR